MLRVAVKNLFAHKFRTLALVLTVVLGVSFVVGTYVLTDTITSVFKGIITDAYAGVDVSVRHTSELGMDVTRAPVPASLLPTVSAVDGVRSAEGNVFAIGVSIIDANGKHVGNPQAPSFGTNWADDPALSPMVLRTGRPPTATDEVVIDAQAYKNGHFHLGDSIQIVTATGPQRFTLVGVAGFGAASNLAGATVSVFELQTAQSLMQRVGLFDSINIKADDGVSAEVVQERVAAVLDPRYEAVTSNDLSSENNKSIAAALGFFRTFMLVFAFVALFVGAFIVYNTYSIVIVERTRELALVRALGASGLGVLVSVLAEAVITGLVASAIGIGAGVMIAVGLQHLLAAFGLEMPTGDLILLGRTVLIAMVGGPLVTALASVIPAFRASRVAPVAAMTQASTGGGRSGLVRNVVGAVLSVGGVIAILVGLDRGALQAVGAGAAAMFIGVAMLAPLISQPVVAAVGIPMERALGVAGQLARDNARRSPRRTGATASALMIGTALMAASFVMSRSITESVDRAVSGSAVADLVITNDSQTGFSAALADEIDTMSGVKAVARYRLSRFKLGNATKNLVAMPASALDPNSSDLAIDVGITSGDMRNLPQGGVAVQADVARDHHWVVGDTIDATMPTGVVPLRLVATYEQNTLVGDYVVDITTFDAAYDHTTDFLVLVLLQDPARVRAVQAEIHQIVDAGYPGLQVRDRAEYVEATKARVSQFTSLITALLVLAIVIALLGVLITMLLSVSERTRELGLLRAVGMSRKQTRAMIRWEAAIVALYGALLGLGLGIFFGLALVRALRRQGVTVAVLPVPTLLILAMVIAVLGVGASVYPARRAARLNVIAAVSSL